MDLSAPYRSVVPSLDGPVLRVLAGTTRPLTGQQVHRLAGVASASGVRKVLSRLVQHGLVTVTSAGPSLLYSANRHHLAWAAVESLMAMRERMIERLRGTVATWEVEPDLVGLFGSAARGDGTVDSDLDLLVISPEALADRLDVPGDPVAVQWFDQVQELRDVGRSLTGNHAQVLELSASAFAAVLMSQEAIVPQWRRDLILLAGERPAMLRGPGRPVSTALSAGRQP